MAETTLVLGPKGNPQPVLVSIFLDGGADGLHLVPPANDKDYRRARPSLAVSSSKALPLDETFFLHPDLAPMHKLYAKGDLAVMHQIGTEENSRSHFEATDYLHVGGRSGGGWLGRFLHLSKDRFPSGPLSAISIGERVSDSLQGNAAVAMRSIEEFHLPIEGSHFPNALGKLYAKAQGHVASAGRETLEAMQRISKIAEEAKAERKQGKQPKADDFTAGLQLIAKLTRLDLGLRAATVDLGSWDSHFGQSTFLSGKISRLADGLGAFAEMLGPDLANVHVVVLTEFGRRVSENGSLGTDHGRGSVAFAMGGGVKGGKVHHDWQGLDTSLLEYPGDVPVKIDYRQLLTPILQKVDPHIDLAKLFPGFTGKPLPLFG